jgi:hypothetical protein
MKDKQAFGWVSAREGASVRDVMMLWDIILSQTLPCLRSAESSVHQVQTLCFWVCVLGLCVRAYVRVCVCVFAWDIERGRGRMRGHCVTTILSVSSSQCVFSWSVREMWVSAGPRMMMMMKMTMTQSAPSSVLWSSHKQFSRICLTGQTDDLGYLCYCRSD